MNRLRVSLSTLLVGLSLLLAACGGGGGGGSGSGNLQVTIQGLPSGVNANVSVSGPNGYTQTLTASTTLSSVAVGSYTVTAGNVTASGATYTAKVTGSPVSVTANQTAQVAVTYASGGGGTGGAISGTVYAPSGDDVANTVVAACPTTDQDCNTSATLTFIITQSGSSASYSFTNVPTGQYQIAAVKDVNGNGKLDSGDYAGVYTTDGQNAAVVSPPASGLDIHMSVYSPGGGGNKPAISSFSASPSSITAGQSSTLSWSVAGATSLSINGVGDVTGKTSVSVSPTATTTYTLTATNSAGSSTATATVTVSSGGGGNNPDVTFLKPSDFQNGSATVTLSNLGTNENVAVIPVYATQDLSPDGMDYSINVSGVTPAALPPSIAPQALSPRQQMAQKLEQNHLKQLAKSTRQVNALLKAGVKPLSTGGLKSQSIGKCPAPYSKGSTQCDFWISASDTQTQITATLEYESANAYWFVQNDDLLDLSQSDLTNLAQVFENTIVPSDNHYFGNFPDVDGNGKIFIVFSHLLYPAGVLGYVYPVDLFSDSQTCPDPSNANTCVHSNEGDIFYATTPGSDLEDTRTQYFQTTMPATMVHELKHLISAGVRLLAGNSSEELWIEEPSAVAAEELAGLGSQKDEIQGYARYGLATPQDFRVVYQGRPSGFEGGLGIYGYNFTLLWRIAEEVGPDSFWKAWTAGPGTGIANLEAHSGGRTFPDMMEDWAVMLLLDHTNQTGALADYSYQDINLRDGTWEDLGYQPLENVTGTTRSLAYYIGKGQGADATIAISSTYSAPYAVVVRYGTALSWDPRDGTMSGTITAPSGGDVNGATVEACYVENGQCNENSANTVFGTISQSGSSFAYNMGSMHYGSYQLYAYQDLNNDGSLDAGDSYNCYTTDNVNCSVASVNPSASGIDVHMVTLTSQSLTGTEVSEAAKHFHALYLKRLLAPLFKR